MTSLVATPEIDEFFMPKPSPISEGSEAAAIAREDTSPLTAPDAVSAGAPIKDAAPNDIGEPYDPAALIGLLLQVTQDITDTQLRGDKQVLRLSEFVDALVSTKDALGLSEAAKRIEAAADAIGGPLRAKLLGGGQDTDQEINALVQTVTGLSEQIKRWAAVSPGLTVPASVDPTSSISVKPTSLFGRITQPWLIGGGVAAAAVLTIIGVIVGSIISSAPQSGGALQEEVVALRQQVNLLTTQNARYKVAINEIVGAGNNLAWFYKCPPEKRPRVPNGGESSLCAFNMTRPFELP
jgi:hypothetical protein